MKNVTCGILLTVFLVGCGGSSGDGPEDLQSVSGKVTLDGNPLPDATVQFTPVSGGRPAVGITNSSGKYTLDYTASSSGATPGEYIVTITTATTKTGEDGNDIEIPERLPAKYNANTELKATVPTGPYDFDLKSEGEVYKEEDTAE